jgi:hypothetical protein
MVRLLSRNVLTNYNTRGGFEFATPDCLVVGSGSPTVQEVHEGERVRRGGAAPAFPQHYGDEDDSSLRSEWQGGVWGQGAGKVELVTE